MQESFFFIHYYHLHFLIYVYVNRRDKIRCDGVRYVQSGLTKVYSIEASFRPCASCTRKGYECIERACKACSREGLAAECNHRKVIGEGTSENPGWLHHKSRFEFSFISSQTIWTLAIVHPKNFHLPPSIDHNRHNHRLLCR